MAKCYAVSAGVATRHILVDLMSIPHDGHAVVAFESRGQYQRHVIVDVNSRGRRPARETAQQRQVFQRTMTKSSKCCARRASVWRAR